MWPGALPPAQDFDGGGAREGTAELLASKRGRSSTTRSQDTWLWVQT
jgi:hypothetical protein